MRQPSCPPPTHKTRRDTAQHIVQRGINREACFFAEEDYHCYLYWLTKSAADWRCTIRAYVLMTGEIVEVGPE